MAGSWDRDSGCGVNALCSTVVILRVSCRLTLSPHCVYVNEEKETLARLASNHYALILRIRPLLERVTVSSTTLRHTQSWSHRLFIDD